MKSLDRCPDCGFEAIAHFCKQAKPTGAVLAMFETLEKRVERLERVITSLAKWVAVTGPPSIEEDELGFRLRAIRQDLAEGELEGGG